MDRLDLDKLDIGENYTARELDSFVSTSDVVVVPSNGSQLFTEPEREYKATRKFEGFFEHSSENGEKYYREKTVYLVEKV